MFHNGYGTVKIAKRIFGHDYNGNMGCNLTTIKHICKK